MEGKSKLRVAIAQVAKQFSQKNGRAKPPGVQLPLIGHGSRGNENGSLHSMLERYRINGDPILGASIYERHRHLVLGCALKILNDRDEAQDATSDIFMKVLDRLRVETPGNFAGWLYAVTRYHCIEIRRKQKKAPIVESLDGQKYLIDSRPDGQALEELHSDLEVAVHQAVQALPQHQRTCIELFYLRNMSYKAIAAQQGIELNDVKTYLQNGKRRLVSLLAPVHTRRAADGVV